MGYAGDLSQQRRHPAALLIIDMINELKFGKAPLLLEEMKKIITPLADLRKRAKAAGLPIIYVNDNYGIWQSELNQIIDKAKKGPGRKLIEKIMPEADDFFVVKPKHSGFFSTPLSTLLSQLGTNTLILSGVAGNICVLFTANDAYMRDYRLFIPQDCCASNVKEDNDYALKMMKHVLQADISKQADLDVNRIIGEAEASQTRVIYEG